MAEPWDDHTDGPTNLDKRLPCDACRRRKVRCSKSEPCDRCTAAGLKCTRDIARKKRGPKKGSGSVIAKLRDETLQMSAQDATPLPLEMAQLQLQMQMPALDRAMSDDSPLASTLSSPTGSQFGDTFSPLSNAGIMPRSVPTDNMVNDGSNFEPSNYTAFTQAGIQLPASWQMQSSDHLLFQAPMSSTDYMSVSDLAQQIFPQAMSSGPNTSTFSAMSIAQTTPTTCAPLTQPASLDAILRSTVSSPSTPATTSPGPIHGPRSLYRSESGHTPVEPRIQALATEVGLSAHFMSQCVRQYFRDLYPIRPIIHESSFHNRMQEAEDLNIEEKILVLSLCATTVLHATPQSDLTMEKKWQLGRQFLDRCFYFRNNSEWIENASIASVQASYHICVALFELKKSRAHHFYIREAIGMAIDQGLHLDSTYQNMDEIQAICARRTFALLFITERGLAILRNKPILITRIPRLSPEYFDEEDGRILAGFSALVNLFSNLDDKFVRLWSDANPTDLASTFEPTTNIASIQHALNNTSIATSNLTSIQKADVFITHHWLRLIFWQASMRQGLISFSPTDEIFSGTYPIAIARDLCAVMKSEFSTDAILVHGMGIFEKLFEIAYTLMDALTIANMPWSESEELRYLFEVLSASPNSQSTYVRMLTTKIESARSPTQSPGMVPG